MTLREIEELLPNGFHDAILERMIIDYVEMKVVFELKLSIDIPIDEGQVRPTYRKGKVTLYKVLYCVIEPPDTTYSYCGHGSLLIDAGPAEGARLKTSTQLPTSLPEGAFTYWFYIGKWNSFIHVAALDARFEWEEAESRL